MALKAMSVPTSVATGGSTNSHPLESWVPNSHYENYHPSQLPTNMKGHDAFKDLTRPKLRRRTVRSLSQSSPSPRTSYELDSDEDFIGTRRVVIHPVQPGDTLVGISLFYGISQALLNKCNRLWPSDSIHTRKELILPLDFCSIFVNPSSKNANTKVVFDEDKVTILTKVLNADKTTNTTTTSLNIVRFPSTHLSHFPPSSSNNSTPRNSSDATSVSSQQSSSSLTTSTNSASYVIDRVLQITEQLGDTIKLRHRGRSSRKGLKDNDFFIEDDSDGVLLSKVGK